MLDNLKQIWIRTPSVNQPTLKASETRLYNKELTYVPNQICTP